MSTETTHRDLPRDLWEGFPRFAPVVREAIRLEKEGELLDTRHWIAYVWYKTGLPTVRYGWSYGTGDWFCGQEWLRFTDVVGQDAIWNRRYPQLMRHLVRLLRHEEDRQKAHNYLSGCPDGADYEEAMAYRRECMREVRQALKGLGRSLEMPTEATRSNEYAIQRGVVVESDLYAETAN
jgi:1,4-alpha-glucan branching enzyme